ncbi:PEP-utilizing enzyme [Nocardia suismassiliense]|uniref:PEP-utilizing enzyme n=1 Tax=Nocardia suismassiliense TaxID=2077092 RepID=A0ABW6QSW1_9NOCA
MQRRVPLGVVIAAIERAYPESRLDQLAAAVTHAAHWLWVADRLLERFVARARQARLPWAEIGTRLGISKQAAQQRFATRVAEHPAATAQRAAWQTGADMMPEAPLVTGVPCSNGVAAGPVRLVRSVDDFAAVRAGDVIVCRTTDPSWTVLFGIAAAVVTETGGMLCHAAIVAREYGIPAVVAAEGAMGALANHRMISVDGTRGHVNSVCAPHR